MKRPSTAPSSTEVAKPMRPSLYRPMRDYQFSEEDKGKFSDIFGKNSSTELMNIWNLTGRPKISTFDQSNGEGGSTYYFGHGEMDIGIDNRAPGYGTVNNFIAESAHALQDKNGMFSHPVDKAKIGIQNLSRLATMGMGMDKAYHKLYDTPGTIEHEAHDGMYSDEKRLDAFHQGVHLQLNPQKRGDYLKQTLGSKSGNPFYTRPK